MTNPFARSVQKKLAAGPDAGPRGGQTSGTVVLSVEQTWPKAHRQEPLSEDAVEDPVYVQVGNSEAKLVSPETAAGSRAMAIIAFLRARGDRWSSPEELSLASGFKEASPAITRLKRAGWVIQSTQQALRSGIPVAAGVHGWRLISEPDPDSLVDVNQFLLPATQRRVTRKSNKKLLKWGEAARYLGLCKNGRRPIGIPFVMLPGFARPFYDHDDLDAWIQKQRVTGI